MAAPVYNERVRQLFASTPHAGCFKTAAGRAARAGTVIELSAEIDEARLGKLAFRVYGCPHTIAAAEAFCELFEGRQVAELANCRTQEFVGSLGIPVEKAGQILLLEDAIHALAADCQTIRD